MGAEDKGSRSAFLTEDTMAARAGHIPSLDGLRAISISLVLCSHYLTDKIPGGLGVYVFFVISGFLISRLMLAEQKRAGSVSLPNFYLRRVLRLLPVVLVFTAVATAVLIALGKPPSPADPLSALFYFANYRYADGPGGTPFVPLWSLSLEEHFYIAFPLLFLGLRGDPRRIFIAMLAVIAIALALRTGVAIARPDLLDTHHFYFRSEYRMDAIAFGVAMAALCELPWGRRMLLHLAHPAALVVGLAVLLGSLLYRDPLYRETLRYTIQGVGIVLAVGYVLFRGAPFAGVLNSWPVVQIGRLSYSLYVWHSLPTHLPYEGPAKPAFLFAATALLAVASYHLIERPALRLRSRLLESGRPSAERAAA